MTNNRLLTAVEIEAVWKQLSMKSMSNSLFRFAGEISVKQEAKAAKAKDEEWALKVDQARTLAEKEARREIGEWLDKHKIFNLQLQHGQSEYILHDSEVESLKKGELPT